MKVAALIVSLFIGSVSAAPAIVWSNDFSSPVVHSSESVKASSLVASLVHSSGSESSLAGAVFLVGRSPDGSETLSGLTSSGSLPLIASKYNDAAAIHSHVSGIESPFSIVRDVGSDTDRRVLQVSLNEFSSKLTSLEQATPETDVVVDENGMVDRAGAISSAELVVVNVPHSVAPSMLDDLVTKAIENKNIGMVILTGVRSSDEVKLERTMAQRRKIKTMEENGKRRRLEEANNGDDDGNNDGTTGVYFVHMTPNILAGILFGLMFTVVTWIGISCMGMIAGQDVYVSKMPTIGREA